MSVGKPFKWSKRFYVDGDTLIVHEKLPKQGLCIIAYPHGWMNNPDKPIDPEKTYFITIEESDSVMKDGR
jgi:hypothetical protein